MKILCHESTNLGFGTRQLREIEEADFHKIGIWILGLEKGHALTRTLVDSVPDEVDAIDETIIGWGRIPEHIRQERDALRTESDDAEVDVGPYRSSNPLDAPIEVRLAIDRVAAVCFLEAYAAFYDKRRMGLTYKAAAVAHIVARSHPDQVQESLLNSFGWS